MSFADVFVGEIFRVMSMWVVDGEGTIVPSICPV